MAAALVGSMGAIAGNGTANTAVTPAWGTSETRAAGNLLLCWVAGYNSTSLPATPTGWSVGPQVSQVATNGNASLSLFYKYAAGSDAAPTIAADTNAGWRVSLAEYSGVPGGLDQSGTNASTAASGTSLVATAGSADVSSGDLVIGGSVVKYSAATTTAETGTFNNGATYAGVDNHATSTTQHCKFGWGVTTGNTSADTFTSGYTTTGAGSSAQLAIVASFKQTVPAPVSTAASAGTSTASGAVTAASQIASSISATSTASASIQAATTIAANSSASTSTASATVQTSASVLTATAAGVSSASGVVVIPVFVPFAASSSTSSTSGSVTAPSLASGLLAAGNSSATASITGPPHLSGLAAASSVASGTVKTGAPLPLSASNATSVAAGNVVVYPGRQWFAVESDGTSGTSVVLSIRVLALPDPARASSATSIALVSYLPPVVSSGVSHGSFAIYIDCNPIAFVARQQPALDELAALAKAVDIEAQSPAASNLTAEGCTYSK